MRQTSHGGHSGCLPLAGVRMLRPCSCHPGPSARCALPAPQCTAASRQGRGVSSASRTLAQGHGLVGSSRLPPGSLHLRSPAEAAGAASSRELSVRSFAFRLVLMCHHEWILRVTGNLWGLGLLKCGWEKAVPPPGEEEAELGARLLPAAGSCPGLPLAFSPTCTAPSGTCNIQAAPSPASAWAHLRSGHSTLRGSREGHYFPLCGMFP